MESSDLSILVSIVLSVVGSSYVVGNMISKRIDDLKTSLCDNLKDIADRVSRLEERHLKD